jgi:predicted ATPase
MRASISGCTNSGKSTLVQSFLQKWPMYQTPSKTYRDVILESGLGHSTNTSAETQLLILDWMMKEQEKFGPKSNVMYDRCPLDNLVYTLYANSKELISDEVCAATISLVRESLKDLDIIFMLRYEPGIKIVDDGMRDTDLDFIKETDQIFGDLYHQYCENLESDIFFPAEDCPAIIQVDGKTVDDRLWFIGEFIDYKGNLIETTDSILDPTNVDLLEKMLGEQQIELGKDAQIKTLMNQIKKGR